MPCIKTGSVCSLHCMVLGAGRHPIACAYCCVFQSNPGSSHDNMPRLLYSWLPAACHCCCRVVLTMLLVHPDLYRALLVHLSVTFCLTSILFFCTYLTIKLLNFFLCVHLWCFVFCPSYVVVQCRNILASRMLIPGASGREGDRQGL